jgi:hypothetical protein
MRGVHRVDAVSHAFVPLVAHGLQQRLQFLEQGCTPRLPLGCRHKLTFQVGEAEGVDDIAILLVGGPEVAGEHGAVTKGGDEPNLIHSGVSSFLVGLEVCCQLVAERMHPHQVAVGPETCLICADVLL